MQSANSSKPSTSFRQRFAAMMAKNESHRTFMLAEACIIGAVTALTALFFGSGVSALTKARIAYCELLPPIVVLPLYGALGGVICGCFVKYIAPEISGSGIPQVKAFLKGFPMKLDIRVAFSKLIGGIVALGVGLPLGREGPTVQVGGATASVLSRVGYQSPSHRRQLIAAGAGAGLAAAFSAPLAGVMFVVEELTKQVSSLSIGTAVVACFFAGVVSKYIGNHTLDVSPSSSFPHADFALTTVPFLFLVGAAAGGLGALFNEGIMKSIRWHDKYLKDQYLLRIGIAGFACGLILALLPPDFKHFNGIRELIFENRSWHFAAVALIANFVLTVWAYSSGAPGGLFAPSLNIGAALGALIAVAQIQFFGGSAVMLELAGMGAFFAAVARVPITATVVVFEMTTDFNVLLPLMISSITAFVVAEKLSPGSLYDRLLEMQGINIEEAEGADPLSGLFVRDAMQRTVETVEASLPFVDLMRRFEQSKHKAFPVIENGILVGIVAQIDVIAKRELLQDQSTVRDVMTPHVMTASADEKLQSALIVFNEHGINRLPVVDADMRIVGILTRYDVINKLVPPKKS